MEVIDDAAAWGTGHCIKVDDRKELAVAAAPLPDEKYQYRQAEKHGPGVGYG